MIAPSNEAPTQETCSDSSLPARLFALAEAQGIRRRGLSAKLADICGVSYKATHKWLTGESMPSKGNAAMLARALGTTSSYLLFGEDVELGAQQEPLPLPLCKILQSYRAGLLDDGDLEMIENFVQMLARKNAKLENRYDDH